MIISPVRDEARYIRLTLESVTRQTWQPMEWIVVDDGSKDDTAAIVQEYAARFPWIRLVRREDRGFRQVGKGVIVAFDYGRERIGHQDWRYIAKLDGDMSFPETYIQVMVERLESDAKLAACSGKVFRPEGDALVEEFKIDEMVAGQFKLYKREAFEAIGGFRQTVLWDGIDFHTARMRGWRTESFHHPQARLTHHRLMGSSDRSVFRGRLRQGGGNWYMGYHWLYAVASGVFRMREKPYVIGGLLLIAGYFRQRIRGEPQYDDPDFRRQLHQWQFARLKALPRRWLRKWTGW